MNPSSKKRLLDIFLELIKVRLHKLKRQANRKTIFLPYISKYFPFPIPDCLRWVVSGRVQVRPDNSAHPTLESVLVSVRGSLITPGGEWS